MLVSYRYNVQIFMIYIGIYFIRYNLMMLRNVSLQLLSLSIIVFQMVGYIIGFKVDVKNVEFGIRMICQFVLFQVEKMCYFFIMIIVWLEEVIQVQKSKNSFLLEILLVKNVL